MNSARRSRPAGQWSELDLATLANRPQLREMAAAMQIAERQGWSADRKFQAETAIVALQYLQERAARAGVPLSMVSPIMIIDWMIEDSRDQS